MTEGKVRKVDGRKDKEKEERRRDRETKRGD